VFCLAFPVTAQAAVVEASSSQATIPTFTITAVERNTSVTIRTSNFPKNTNFDVLMNKIGTKGINGIKVTTTNSGNGGSFTATYTIPAELKGLKQIAIRLQSTSGYYAYNWFYNNTTTGSSGNGNGNGSGTYKGIPTFSISAVVRNSTVTILTNNFPKNMKFNVLMNYIGTQGRNGVLVDTINSGSGGAFSATFTIPSEFHGLKQIAIRLESSSGYYAYNWFYNTTTK
jgi:hypothetical protein